MPLDERCKQEKVVLRRQSAVFSPGSIVYGDVIVDGTQSIKLSVCDERKKERGESLQETRPSG
jgi:hypothetical protein